MDALYIFLLFTKVCFQLEFSSGVLWNLLCSAYSLSVLPGAQDSGTASLYRVSKTPLSNVQICKKHFLRYVGLFPTDWEEDFPSQLSLFTWSLWHSLFLTNNSLKSAFHHNLLSHFCLFLWGMTNIENTCRQCQADAASLLYITWCSSSETFHFHLKILPTPP